MPAFPATERRTKIVSFRASEAEYNELLRVCVERKARTLSDLARSVVCELIVRPSPSPEGGLASMIERINSTVDELSSEMKDLTRTLEKQPAPATGD